MNKENEKKEIEAIYPLTHLQEGMLYHCILEPDPELYFEQYTCRLSGNLNTAAFRQAWQELIKRHTILRTSFVWKNTEQMMQVVLKSATLPFRILDWSAFSNSEKEKKITELLAEDKKCGFNFNTAPLMNITVIKLSEEEYQFIWNHHHLIVDAWSQSILLKELFQFYEAFCKSENICLETPRPFRDYVMWLRNKNENNSEEYWRKYLKGFHNPAELPFELKNSGGEGSYHHEFSSLSLELTGRLNEFARSQGVTLSTVLQCAWAVLLSRYNESNDVVFGMTTAGRPPEFDKIESIIGLFINTIPVRIRFSERENFCELVRRIHTELLDLREHEYSSLVSIHSSSEVPGETPLFRNIFVFENTPMEKKFTEQMGSLKISGISASSKTNYPLILVAMPGENLTVGFAYDENSFTPEAIKTLLGQITIILNSVTMNPDKKICDLSLLSEQEQKKIIIDWNSRFPEHLEVRLLHEIFLKQASLTPDDPAVTYEGRTLTYKELNEESNRLANYLHMKGLRAEDFVALCINRSVEMIVCILGILKAGGAYLPVDPEYPEERISYILKDASIKYLITEEELIGKLPSRPENIICMDKDKSKLEASGTQDPGVKIYPDNTAYIIYTSGSTGKPKGVVVTHRGIFNLLDSMKHDWGVNSKSRTLQFASIAFDAAMPEIFLPLSNGAELLIAPRDTVTSPEKLSEFILANSINLFLTSPSVLAMLESENIPQSLSVVSAGEACPVQLAKKWSERGKFINGYGPTEVTVGCCWNVSDNSDFKDSFATFPVGRPFRNVKIYILDSRLRPLPPGLPGEIHVSSPGLARGYLNRADLTAEKFIPDPFSNIAGNRLYKTGDIAKYLPDGNIEFIGRKDHQVKIRGFRIELPEIESALMLSEKIQNAVVLVKERKSGEKYLSAYVIPSKGITLTAQELRQHLSQKLPDYMIPAEYNFLEAFPTNSNAKIDRKELLKINAAENQTEEKEKTFSHLEELLAIIWEEVLELPNVNIHSNFFDLGGHSLKAARVLSRLRKVTGANLSLKDLFNNPTVHLLAQLIQRGTTAGQENSAEDIISPSEKRNMAIKRFGLSFAQQRLWFLEQMSPGEVIFNLPLAVRLKGEINLQALKTSLEEIVKRHEPLRTVFSSIKGEPFQVILDLENVDLQYIDLSGLEKVRAEEEMQRIASSELRRKFDISSELLFRYILVKISAEEHVLLIIMHHIITDGWSMNVFLRELMFFYNSFTDGNLQHLPELPIQYADYAEWQRKWFNESRAEEQIEYWKRELAGINPLLELPADFPRPQAPTFNGASEKFTIGKRLEEKLRAFCRKESVTPYIALLSAYQILLARMCDCEDILVGSPVANRTRHETENLIGFFVNTVVMRANFSGNPGFRDVLKANRTKVLGAFAHQDLPFENLVEKLQPERSLNYAPIFQAAFVFQNFVSSRHELQGLKADFIELDSTRTEYDITLTVAEEFTGGLIAYWEYSADLFRRSTALGMIEQFLTLLENLLDNPDKSIWETRILKPAEYDRIVKQLNSNKKSIPEDCCIKQVFENFAETYPEKIALTYSDNANLMSSAITFKDLNEKANRLANYLRRKGLKEEDNAAVSIPRSVDLIVAVLAVLKAGGVFIPMDPTYPKERLSFMLQDSKTRFLLTTEPLAKQQYSEFGGLIIETDKEADLIQKESPENLHSMLFPENLAYIIYTSGSTGRPKGAMLTHRGLYNLSLIQKTLEISNESVNLQFASSSFDAFVWEISISLFQGARLDLISQSIASSVEDLADIIHKAGTTVVALPPFILARLPEKNKNGELLLESLKTLIVGGEKCPAELANYWGPKLNFYNSYGPTEVTVCASNYLCSEKCEQSVPIGPPADNCELYVLDKHMNPVPPGFPGELFIGGTGLGRGYINNPALSAERFLPNPFSSSKGARMYKSGDLVKFNEKGILEFIGRIDFQLKLHGFRIEPGEIESVMREHPGILQAAVKVHNNGSAEGRLVGYLVPRNGDLIQANELRKFLRKKLPEYMVPQSIIPLVEFPLTRSGKIDYRALPSPDSMGQACENKYIEPRNETERKLALITAELLKLNKIGINDNFFEMGGHSLLITRLVSSIKEEFDVEIPLRSVFEYPTISEIALIIQQEKGNNGSRKAKMEKVSRGEESILDLIREIENLPENDAQ